MDKAPLRAMSVRVLLVESTSERAALRVCGEEGGVEGHLLPVGGVPEASQEEPPVVAELAVVTTARPTLAGWWWYIVALAGSFRRLRAVSKGG